MPPDRYVTHPCPSEACHGVSRLFEVHVHRSAAGEALAEVELCTVCGHNPGRPPADDVARPDCA